jgi:pimeloyl-ACP methyl ester carboxylesterase
VRLVGSAQEKRVARAVIDGIALEYRDSGAGEPVVFIHGAFIADAFRPLLAERVLADGYRLISYHRRGYGGSSRATGAVSFDASANDCRLLLSRLGVQQAHVVGHSHGANVALQLALQAPGLVRTLSLLEAGLLVGESAESYRQALLQSVCRYEAGGARVAIDESLQARWPSYREGLPRLLPGAFEQAVADAPTFFEAEARGSAEWSFGAEEARRIRQPTLVVLGEQSAELHPRFTETYRFLLEWLPDADGFVLPDATHFLQIENPRALAQALSKFWARHSA